MQQLCSTTSKICPYQPSGTSLLESDSSLTVFVPGLRGGIVVSAFASQQEGPSSNATAIACSNLCMQGFSSGHSGFIPQSKQMLYRLIGIFKLCM